MAEYDIGASTPAKRYRYTENSFAPVSYSEGNNDFAVHSDYLDTPKALTDASGNVVWNTVLSPYGNTVENTDPDGDGQEVAFNLRFPGQYHDRETRLYYNWNRTYDPESGRYVQPDPIGLTGGLNTYLYGSASPTMAIDPEGLWAQVAVGVGIRVIGGRAAGAAVSRVFQNAFGRTAGRVLSCLSIGYCSESSEGEEASEEEDDSSFPEGESCPSTDPGNWEKIKGSNQSYKPKGGKEPIFEKDRAGDRAHGGSAWKKWEKHSDWKTGKRRDGTYDINGNRLRD